MLTSGLGACAQAGARSWREVMTLRPSDPDRLPPARPGFFGGSLVQGLAWSPDGTRLAAAAVSIRPLHLWDARTGALLARIPRSESTTKNELVFTRDGRYLLAVPVYQGRSPGDYAFSVLDAETGAVQREIREGLPPGVQSGARRLALSPDGRWVAGLFDGAGVAVYSTADWRPAGSFKLHRFIAGSDRGLAFSPDGERLAVTGIPLEDPHGPRFAPPPDRGQLEVYDWREGRRVMAFRAPSLEAVAWRPGSEVIAVATGGLMASLPDGRAAPLGTPLGRVSLVDARGGGLLQTWLWPDNEAAARALDWSPDGGLLAVAASGTRSASRLLTPGQDAPAALIGRPTSEESYAISFRPDGRAVAYGVGAELRIAVADS